MPQASSSAATQSTSPPIAYETTPEIDVGTMAANDVAAAWRCVNPTSTSAGTITVPPPMPNSPDSSPAATPTTTNVIVTRILIFAMASRQPIRPAPFAPTSRHRPETSFHRTDAANRFPAATAALGRRPIRSFPAGARQCIAGNRRFGKNVRLPAYAET